MTHTWLAPARATIDDLPPTRPGSIPVTDIGIAVPTPGGARAHVPGLQQ